MYWSGQTEHGKYSLDFKHVHPKLLERYYGAPEDDSLYESDEDAASDEEANSSDAMDEDEDEDNYEDEPTGKKKPKEDTDSDSDAMDVDKVEAAHASNFKHEAVQVPKHQPPFEGHANEDVLQAALERAIVELDAEDIIPLGYGMRPEEWGSEGYPTVECIQVGRRGRKEYYVSLTDKLWRPRAIRWVQALHSLNELTFRSEQ